MSKRGGLERMIEKESEVKILTIDIETSPIEAYTWGPKWETNLIEITKQSNIICYSAKWLKGTQETKALVDYKGYKKNKVDDSKLVKNIHKLLDEADIVVTQNGVDFDIKVMNARFLNNGLAPPSPYKVIDTKREAKKYLRLPSYSLDDMGEYFGLGRKMEHEGFNLWKKCMAGDKSAWERMKKYNAQDVRLTENVYLKLRPFMKTHPNLLTFDVQEDKSNCPKCESPNVHSRGFLITTTSKYHRAQCRDCGGWYRYGKNEYKGKKHISI
jgi:DNA polymerase elongation subunit (family B)